MQAKVRTRDKEIQRLHERYSAGLDVDKLSLQRQHERSEQLVLTLSQQVDSMNTQIAELEKQVGTCGLHVAPSAQTTLLSPAAFSL